MGSVSYDNNQVLARWMDSDYSQKPSRSTPAAPAEVSSETEMEAYSSDYLALKSFAENFASKVFKPKVAGYGLAAAGVIIGVASLFSKDRLPQLANVTPTGFGGDGLNNLTSLNGNSLSAPSNGNCFNSLPAFNASKISVFKPIVDVNGSDSCFYSHGFHANQITDSLIGQNNDFSKAVVSRFENSNVTNSSNNNSATSIALKNTEVSKKNQLNKSINKADFCFKNETKQFKISDLAKVSENKPVQNNTAVVLSKVHSSKPWLVSAGNNQTLGLNNTFTYKKETNKIAKPVTGLTAQKPVMQETTISEMFTNTTSDELPVCKIKRLSELEKRISEVVSGLSILAQEENSFAAPSIDHTDGMVTEEQKLASLKAIKDWGNHIDQQMWPFNRLNLALGGGHNLQTKHYKLLENEAAGLLSEMVRIQDNLWNVKSVLQNGNTKLHSQQTQNVETAAKLKKLLETSVLWENTDEDQVGNLKNRISKIISRLNSVKTPEAIQFERAASDIQLIEITDELRKEADLEVLKKCEREHPLVASYIVNERCWSKWFPKAVELKNAENFNLNARITNLKNEMSNAQNALDVVNAQFKNAVIQNNEASEELKNLLADLSGAE